MNERSSRAHTILLLNISQRLPGSDTLVRSHLHLVDLAGSERIKKSKAHGVRKNEAVGINTSLLVLGKCIAALVEGKQHVPYFECKLTMILKAAFGGNSRTTAIITCHSDDIHADESVQVNCTRCVCLSFKTLPHFFPVAVTYRRFALVRGAAWSQTRLL
jgi:kinesin family member 5